MLAKNRTTAFINTLVALVCSIGASLYFDSFPQQLTAAPPLLLFILIVLVFALAWFFSRTALVMEAGAASFGVGGLIRWAMFGVVAGAAITLSNQGLRQWLGEKSALRPGLEPILDLLWFSLFYWLIFHRNPFSLTPAEQIAFRSEQTTRRLIWFMVGGGVFITLAGALAVVISWSQGARAQGWALATLAMGLGCLITGLQDRFQNHPRVQKWLLGITAVLALFSITSVIIDLVLNGFALP